MSYTTGINAVLKTDRDHLKSSVRLAFERALLATKGVRTKVSGKVYRALQSNTGIRRGL
jgi:hypothetical protein